MSIFPISIGDGRLLRNFLIISLRDRYLGSKLGFAWAVLNPLLMFTIYTIVFGFVFKVRLPGADTTLTYAIWLISGFGPWMAICEALTVSASSVIAAAGLIKNVAFKSEILPVVGALTSVVTLAVSFAFLALLMIIDGTPPTWHAVFLIPSVLTMYLVLSAVAPLLAAVSVFVRDTVQILPTLLQVVLFCSPVLYPIETVPGPLRVLAAYNPIYILAEAFRDSLINHRVPDLAKLAVLAVASLLIAKISFWFYGRAKGQFEAYL